MSSRAIVLVLAGAGLLAAACFSYVGLCAPATACVPSHLQVGVWLALDGPVSVTLVGIALIAWWARTAMLLLATERAVRRLAAAAPPSRLFASQIRVGALRLVCVKGDRDSAFCSGTWRPTIFVGEGIVDQLGDDELDAVLLHELDHANRYEPLRRAARQAAAEVFFFAPILRWWAERRSVQVELAADRAAIQQVGQRAVARALWTLGGGVPSGVAAFAGAARLRVAQLLGDSSIQPGPPRRVVAATVVGTYLALQVLACATAPLLYLK